MGWGCTGPKVDHTGPLAAGTDLSVAVDRGTAVGNHKAAVASHSHHFFVVAAAGLERSKVTDYDHPLTNSASPWYDYSGELRGFVVQGPQGSRTRFHDLLALRIYSG